MLRPMRRKRLAGPNGCVLHFIPCSRIVEGSEDHPTHQFQTELIKRRAQYSRVFGHIADRSQLNALIARFRAFLQHLAPGRIARTIGKFNAPGTGRIGDFDSHD